MGQFIGGFGAAFILAAAATVIMKFFLDINIIKDRKSVIAYSKISLSVIAIGAVYLFLAAMIFNSIKSRVNFFEFDTLFNFMGVKKTVGLCCDFDIRHAADGLMMPLYPYIVNVIGKIVFNQYLLTASFISFASACVSACVLYSLLSRKVTKEKSVNILLAAANLPYAFMLFAPTYISFSLMLILLSALALEKKNMLSFAAATVLACASSKIGFISVLIYPLYRLNVFDFMANVINKSKVLNNGVINRIILAVLVTANGVILSVLIRSIR